MLDFRLKAFERFKQLKEPNWQKPKRKQTVKWIIDKKRQKI